MTTAIRPFWPFRITIAVRARVVVVRPRPAPKPVALPDEAALARASLRTRLSPHLLRDLGLEA